MSGFSDFMDNLAAFLRAHPEVIIVIFIICKPL